jgi:hypothetical protein
MHIQQKARLTDELSARRRIASDQARGCQRRIDDAPYDAYVPETGNELRAPAIAIASVLLAVVAFLIWIIFV